MNFILLYLTPLETYPTQYDSSFAFLGFYLTGDVFGGFGDQVNTRSQFLACSHGQLSWYPGPDPSSSITSNYAQVEEAPGVISVDINDTLDDPGKSDTTIYNLVANAAAAKLGITFPGPFTHVTFAVQGCYGTGPGDCGFAAYAYINSWGSFFQGVYMKYSAVQMHEYGMLSSNICNMSALPLYDLFDSYLD